MRSRKRKLFLFISLAAISTYMYWMMLDLDVPHVIVCRETHETNASFSTNLKHVHGRPSSLCDNILGNLTNGRWVVTAPGQTAYYDDLLLRYWQKRGILEKLWRNDGKCGYQKWVIVRIWWMSPQMHLLVNENKLLWFLLCCFWPSFHAHFLIFTVRLLCFILFREDNKMWSFSLGFIISFVVLRSESPSGKCAKLHSAAASNNRDHPTRSLLSSPLASTVICSLTSRALLDACFTSIVIGYSSRSLHRDISIIACSRHVYIGVVLRVHPVRGESHI